MFLHLKSFTLSLILVIHALELQAHPVTFEGGTMLKSMAREDMSETSVTHTYWRKTAVGMEYDRLLLGDLDTSWGLAELNHLVKRWNGDHSQANIYLLSGLGGFWSDGTIEKDVEWAGKWGVQMDYETRQFYTLLSWSSWYSESVDTHYALYRIGFAPFLAGYNDLNVWAILQMDYNKDMRNELQVTPFLRFFYKNILWEMGASFRGNFYWQFMVHL